MAWEWEEYENQWLPYSNDDSRRLEEAFTRGEGEVTLSEKYKVNT